MPPMNDCASTSTCQAPPPTSCAHSPPCVMLSLPPHLRQEYFASAPQEEREAADALMEREFGRLAQLNEGVIDDAVKQVGEG